MRSLPEIKKDNLEAACRMTALKTGRPYAVVKRGDDNPLILEKALLQDGDQVTYEHTGRV